MISNHPQLAETDPTVYHSLFETLQAPILIIDGQTAAILDANPAACSFYGYTHTELTGKTIFDLSTLTPAEASQRISRIARGEIVHMQTRHRLANGEIREEFGIEVFGSRDEKLVRLSVWDNGIGIQEQDLPRLFQPFVQLDARLARQYEGAGLGLVLVKQTAELLGGSVSVESVFGQGSRFTVTLPWFD